MAVQGFGFTQLQMVNALVVHRHGVGCFDQFTAAFCHSDKHGCDRKQHADVEMQVVDFGWFFMFLCHDF